MKKYSLLIVYMSLYASQIEQIPATILSQLKEEHNSLVAKIQKSLAGNNAIWGNLKEAVEKSWQEPFYLPISDPLCQQLREKGEIALSRVQDMTIDTIRYRRNENERYAYYFAFKCNEKSYFSKVRANIQPASGWISLLFQNVVRATIETIHTLPQKEQEEQDKQQDFILPITIGTAEDCLIWGPLTSREKKGIAAAGLIAMASGYGLYRLLKK